MQTQPGNDATVRQGRVLALVATIVVPFLIAGYGIATGYPTSVVVAAMLIWGTGTSFWLRSVWPRLRANDRHDSPNGRR